MAEEISDKFPYYDNFKSKVVTYVRPNLRIEHYGEILNYEINYKGHHIKSCNNTLTIDGKLISSNVGFSRMCENYLCIWMGIDSYAIGESIKTVPNILYYSDFIKVYSNAEDDAVCEIYYDDIFIAMANCIYPISDHQLYYTIGDEIYLITDQTIEPVVISKDPPPSRLNWIGYPADKYTEIKSNSTYSIGKFVICLIPTVFGIAISINNNHITFSSMCYYLRDKYKFYLVMTSQTLIITEDEYYWSEYIFEDDNILVRPGYIIQYKEHKYNAKYFLVGDDYVYFGVDKLYRIPRINEIKFIDVPVDDV